MSWAITDLDPRKFCFALMFFKRACSDLGVMEHVSPLMNMCFCHILVEAVRLLWTTVWKCFTPAAVSQVWVYINHVLQHCCVYFQTFLFFFSGHQRMDSPPEHNRNTVTSPQNQACLYEWNIFLTTIIACSIIRFFLAHITLIKMLKAFYFQL